MYGLGYRMKQLTSLGGKIGADTKEFVGYTFDKVAAKISDAVRYNAVFSTKEFTAKYKSIKTRLEKIGYTEYKSKNMFENYDRKGGIKSIQNKYVNKNGYLFEFQFQTYETQSIKEVSHIFYEAQRKVNTAPVDKYKLGKIITKIYSGDSTPQGAKKL